VSRKKKKKKQAAGAGPAPGSEPRFAPGARVRVKAGTKDPDFPDIPLGGWAGVVVEIDDKASPPLYLVEWGEETLDAMHPVYLRRCEREGLEVEGMWLAEADLEPDAGGPVTPEKPGELVPRPLGRDEPEDRVLAVFGLTGDDPLPEVNAENLRRYHEYLSARLKFPYVAMYLGEAWGEGPRADPVLVVGLAPAEEADPEMGLMAEIAAGDERLRRPLLDLKAVVTDRASDRTDELVEDYVHWVENAPGPEQDEGPEGRGWPLLTAGSLLAGAGAVVGACLEAVEGARPGAQIGAGVLGVLGLLFGGVFEARLRARALLPAGFLAGALFSLLLGAAAGALLGVLVMAYAGTILGAITGSVVRRLLRVLGRTPPGELVCALVGGCFGALGQALFTDMGRASTGALYGAAAGVALGLVLLLGAGVYLVYLTGGRR
jgi:hypothetical protein